MHLVVTTMIQLCLNSTCVLFSHPSMSAVSKKANRKTKFMMQAAAALCCATWLVETQWGCSLGGG